MSAPTPVAMRARATGLTVIGASAGSGKTHRLTQEVLDALVHGDVDLPGLIAVTYTKRAQVELASRIRRTLLEKKAPERAARLPLANVGTVHAACLRLVRELALDAGLSPSVDVLPDADRLMRTVLEDELSGSMQKELLGLASRMAIFRDAQRDRVDWVTPVVDVVTLARHGRIAAGALPAMAARSIEALESLLPPVTREDLDALLGDAIDASLRAIEASGCETNKTAAVLRDLEIARRDLARGALDWPTWCKLGKLDPGKKARAAIEPVSRVSRRVLEHPRLRGDLARFTSLVFEAARSTLDAYAHAKRERNVVDYVDMIDEALTLLEDPEVAADLRERLRLVVVDELQDSSPIQLALFLRLHALAGASRWVGDPKQCIFEYAGADPALMEATVKWVAAAGGRTDRLGSNYRTRPDLVELCNTLFATAFRTVGVDPNDVCVTPKRALPDDLEKLPPVGVWSLETKNKGGDAFAIAEGVRRLLDKPHLTRVVDRHTQETRNVRAGDIAILVSTNKAAEEIATALAAHRIGVALARTGLLGTPEGTALQAALALLVDPDASLERAVLEALHGFGGEKADAWLSAKIRRRGEGEGGSEGEGEWLERLAAVRGRRDLLSPGETVDAVLSALDLAALCARWPDAVQRLANLDALRALTAEYEARCVEVAEGASVAGLLRFFAEVAAPIYLRGEEVCADAQAEARGDHAVTILTYHRSKGLEWPVVVLASLDRESRRDAFDVVPECDEETLDPDDPLRGRWIRFWPWPFGPNAGHELDDLAAKSREGTRIAAREHRERVRLLYVGFTRARDHLILAVRPGKTQWLDDLQLGSGRPALAVPRESARFVRVLDVQEVEHKIRCRFWTLGAAAPERREAEPAFWFDRVKRAPVVDGYRIVPSEAHDAPGAHQSTAVHAIRAVDRLHPPLALAASPEKAWREIGDAIHAFLACDVEGLEEMERTLRAARLLRGVGLGGSAEVEKVIRAADALRSWIERRYPGAAWRREVPVRAKIDGPSGEREIVGSVDLLLEIGGGDVVIVDHKSDRVDGEGGFRARAGVHAPQLATYAMALEAAGLRIAGRVVHFVVGGGVVELA